MVKRKIPFILAIVLGTLSLLLFTFDAHAESTSETPRQLCADARRDGSYTILEDTQDRCVYVSPGVIKIEHFYQGNQLCLRTTGFKEVLTFSLDADGEVTLECFDRVYPAAPTQEVVKQPPPEPTAAPEVKVLVFGTDVKAGDTVIAEGKSKKVIFLPEGGKIDLKEGAKIKFHSKDEIETISGIFRFLIKNLTQPAMYRMRIRTTNAVIGVRGTEFLVDDSKNGNTTVKVIDGTVDVSSADDKGTVQVATGQETKTAKGGLPAKPKVFDPKTLDNWWEGLPTEAPSDASDFLIGLVTLGVLGGGIYWVVRRIKKVAPAAPAPVTPKRSFILRWGNTILFIVMIVLGLFVGSSKDIEGAAVSGFLALNIFYLIIPVQMVLAVVRIFKKYHRFRSFIWLFITPIMAFLLVMSFLPPPKT